MAREVSVRDLRNDTAAVVAAVQRDERLVLTVNRRAVADIVPHAEVRSPGFQHVRAACPLLPVDSLTASCFARLADEAISAGRRLHHHDTWIAATALRHGVAVVTQGADFAAFESVPVVRV